MHELWLGEEGLMFGGNSGTAAGNNAFALGTANTPTATLLVQAGLIPNATNVSCRVVELAMLGNPSNTQFGYGLFPTVASGLTPSYVRTNYDGSTTTINGAIGQLRAASSVVLSAAGSNQAQLKLATPKPGAVARGWYL